MNYFTKLALDAVVNITYCSRMDKKANSIIDGLGGTTVVARLIEAPITTVHSWRRIGIPTSRLAHLKLAAKYGKIAWPEEMA
jgi:hypothetical protein